MSAEALVDTHCHFDLFRDPQQVLLEAERDRIYSIAVTNTPSVFDHMQRLAEGLTYVRAAVGLHPELALERASELPILERKLSETRYVGEIGLDYKVVVRPEERARQRAVFQAILESCASAGGRILTIHSRRAEADVIAALRESHPGPFILHWFSGSLKTLRDAVAAGAYFSVNAAMVDSERGRRLIKEVPPERMLTESDGPFVLLGGRPARPSSVLDAIAGISSIQGTRPEEVRRRVFSNFERLLRELPEGP